MRASKASSLNVTTQPTSNVLKAQLAISSYLMIFGGFSWFMPYGRALDGSERLSWPATMMIIGGIWYVVTKIGIWWQHG